MEPTKYYYWVHYSWLKNFPGSSGVGCGEFFLDRKIVSSNEVEQITEFVRKQGDYTTVVVSNFILLRTEQ